MTDALLYASAQYQKAALPINTGFFLLNSLPVNRSIELIIS